MRKIAILLSCLFLVACGYKITKIDLPEPQIEELRKSYPELESGYMVLHIKKKSLDNQD